MIPPVRDEPFTGGILPEMLAGVSVRIEAEEDLTIRPYQVPQPPILPATNGAAEPTPDHLAGIYLSVEAAENLTVRPPTAASAQAPGVLDP